MTTSNNNAAPLLKQDLLDQVDRQKNHYAEHLAEVNKSSAVIATQDIFNENGLLIVPKSTDISHTIAERILNHKLLKPLEEQVQLQNALTSEGLRNDLCSLLDKYPDLQQIHSVHKFQDALDRILGAGTLPPALIQKLTVMRERLPQEYEKSLFCAWLSALIATEARMQDKLIRSAFFAGLAHDICLLNISHQTLHKREALSPNEWREIQSHVVAGYLMLSNLSGVNPVIAQAVLEHHERCDGSGYPLGKTYEDLDLLGQIVGMADSLQAIRINQFAKCGRTMRDAIPYLHMNAQTHFLVTYKAVYSILCNSGLEPSQINPFADVPSLISHLMDQGKKLQNADTLLDLLLELVFEDAECYKKLVRVVQPVLMMMNSSGLLRKEIFEWLETLQNNVDKKIRGELFEMELMQNELYWQLNRVNKFINDHTESNCCDADKGNKDQLRKVFGQIHALFA